MSIYQCRYCHRRYCHCPNCHCRCCYCRKFCYGIIYSFFSQLNNCLFGNQDNEYIDCEKGKKYPFESDKENDLWSFSRSDSQELLVNSHVTHVSHRTLKDISNNEGTKIITNQPSNIPYDFELEKKQSTNKQFNFPNQSIKKRCLEKNSILSNTITRDTSSVSPSWNIIEDVYEDVNNNEYEKKYNNVFEE